MRTIGPRRPSAAAPTHPRHGVVRRLLRHMPSRRLRRIASLAVVVVALVVAITLLVTTPTPGGQATPPTECRQPLAMNVLVSSDLEQTIATLAARFGQARRDGADCPEYAMTVYGTSPGNVLQAFAQQWRWGAADATSEYFQPTRDVGPPPAIWIPGSSAEAWLAGGVSASGGSGSASPAAGSQPTGQRLEIQVGQPLAWAHPVVAVSPGLADQLPGGAAGSGSGTWQWPQLLPTLERAGAELVRPNPTSSSIGLLHTMALYAALGTDDEIRELENTLNANIRKRNYPADDDTKILCHYGSIAGQDTTAALLVSDRSLSRYLASRDGCNEQPSRLIPLGLQGVPAMDHPFVTVRWPGRLRAERVAAAQDFERWLHSDPEAQAMLGDAAGGDPTEVADPSSAHTAMRTYQRQRARGRVLIALENSVLMTETASTLNEGSPLEASKSAVEQAMTLLGTDDEVGLMSFSGRNDRTPLVKPEVPLGQLDDAVAGQSRRSRLISLNVAAPDQAADQSPLYNVIDQGLQTLAGNRHSKNPDISALVVIADGRSAYGETLAALRSRLSSMQGTPGGDIPVYVLAFHPNVCKDLDGALARTVGGSCTGTTAGNVVSDLRKRLAGLWKGPGQ